jgi:thiamine transport system ATP-binding protein
MLEVEDVTVRFGPVTAVDGAVLTVPARVVMAIMGPSGSGKSTLLRAVAGLEPVDGGVIRWDGVDISDVPAHRRRFALMFQDYALFPHRSVAGNVAFGLRMQGWDDEATVDRVADVLDMVGLSGLGSRPVSELSGGQQQRVALGRTLAPKPRLILLDEPLGALDRVLRDQLLDDMRSIFETLGTTVLYVTHDRQEAFAVADVISVMKDGRIVRSDAPEGLWTDPGSAFVAGQLGLDNVVPASELGPWLPDGAPLDRIAIIPGRALRLTADGGVPATVIRDRFEGGSHRVTVLTAHGLELHIESDRRHDKGQRVSVLVDTGAVMFAD